MHTAHLDGAFFIRKDWRFGERGRWIKDAKKRLMVQPLFGK